VSDAIQAVRGMNDLLPDQVVVWQQVERVVRSVMAGYGYQEIRLPVVERTELFARSIGEHTDIVEKEMYSFTDRNGDGLTLRPEGTAGVVRAAIENGMLRGQIQRLWYAGPMFRHERPQRGRYRQFHQVGVETFGAGGPDIDAELVLMSARLWRELGLDGVTLQLNSLGTAESRARYRQQLLDYLKDRRDELDEDSLRRLERNPLRVLDSKAPQMAQVVAGAPRLLDHVDDESRSHFEGLCRLLDTTGVQYEINPHLVRGLDYYNRTVFEWVTDRLGAQGTVCAGGRFDGLVEQLGGSATPAAGFAMGLERLVELMSAQDLAATVTMPQVYLVAIGDGARQVSLAQAEALRSAGLRVLDNCGGGSVKTQMKRADRSGAAYAVILGDEEISTTTATVKPLREQADQARIPFSELPEQLLRMIQAGA